MAFLQIDERLTSMKPSVNMRNHFLIAMPQLMDPNFADAVTYICDHTEEGAMGIIINQPMHIKLGDIFEQMDIKVTCPESISQPIFFGGPLQRERGFILHKPGGDWHSSVELSEQLAITTSRDILEAIAAGEGPEDSTVFLGYAAWEPGQLEQEIAESIWLSCPANLKILFDTPVIQRRAEAARLIGIDIHCISSNIGHA